MTRKDYQKFAQAFKECMPIATWERTDDAYMIWKTLVEESADIFAEDNLRFDRQKFYAACGYDE